MKKVYVLFGSLIVGLLTTIIVIQLSPLISQQPQSAVKNAPLNLTLSQSSSDEKTSEATIGSDSTVVDQQPESFDSSQNVDTHPTDLVQKEKSSKEFSQISELVQRTILSTKESSETLDQQIDVATQKLEQFKETLRQLKMSKLTSTQRLKKLHQLISVLNKEESTPTQDFSDTTDEAVVALSTTPNELLQLVDYLNQQFEEDVVELRESSDGFSFVFNEKALLLIDDKTPRVGAAKSKHFVYFVQQINKMKSIEKVFVNAKDHFGAIKKVTALTDYLERQFGFDVSHITTVDSQKTQATGNAAEVILFVQKHSKPDLAQKQKVSSL